MIESPTRADPCFFTNSDALIEGEWREPDETSVPIASATATFRFEMLPVDPPPDPPADPYEVTIDGTDTAAANGFFDAEALAEGRVALTVRPAAWAGLEAQQTGNGGTFDVLAKSATGGRQQVLLRGQFVVVEGVTPPT